MEPPEMSTISSQRNAARATPAPWVSVDKTDDTIQDSSGAGVKRDHFQFEGVPLTVAPPTKAEIAKMGYEKFRDWTLEHTSAEPTDKVVDQIASGYATIKKQ